jgi:hypothetical protein
MSDKTVVFCLLFALLLLAGCATAPPSAQCQAEPPQQELAETLQKYSWSPDWLENYPVLRGSLMVSVVIVETVAAFAAGFCCLCGG